MAKYMSSTRRCTAASTPCVLCAELCRCAASERAASASARADAACSSAACFACGTERLFCQDTLMAF